MKPKANGYTRIADGQLRGLQEAGASANETRAYTLLARFHNDASHPSRAWCLQQLAQERMGMRPDVFTRSLGGLCRKVFATDERGNQVTVLKRITAGHNGMAAVYEDNLYRMAVLEGSYPREVARQNCHATEEAQEASSKAISTRYSTESSKAISYGLQGSIASPDKRYNPPAALLAPQAKQSRGSQPNKQDESKSTFPVSGGGAREETRAATRPAGKPRIYHGMDRAEVESVTYEDWAPIYERWVAGGNDALTETERKSFSAGWAQGFQNTYSALSLQREAAGEET